MIKTMNLELYSNGGGYIKREISYQGDSLEEIARNIEQDENSLLEYMQTGDTNGVGSFCFGGFMFRNTPINSQWTPG